MVGKSLRSNFYNRKGYFKRKFKELDIAVMSILTREAAALIVQPLSAYHNLGYRIIKLGNMVEELMQQAVQLDLSIMVRRDLAHSAMMLEVFALKLRQVAESKWGDTLMSFPAYVSPFEAQGEVEPTKGMSEMDKILGGVDD